MSKAPGASVPNGRATPSELTWTRSEKRIAREAFGAALRRELSEVIDEAKRMASQINEPSELWDLEHYLTQRRKEIDSKYDARPSRMPAVFGRLLHENRLQEEQLRGLGNDKLRAIQAHAAFLTEINTPEFGA